MPQAGTLRELIAHNELQEVLYQLNERFREFNAYHLDAEGVEGLTVYLGPNGFAVYGDTISNITTDTTLTPSTRWAFVDASSAAVTITLPTAASSVGMTYVVKKIDSSANKVTVDGNGSETIDDSTTIDLTSQYDAVQLMSDGTEWWII